MWYFRRKVALPPPSQPLTLHDVMLLKKGAADVVLLKDGADDVVLL